MIWREPRNHVDDCYFRLVETSDYNERNENKLVYSNIECAIRPVPHSDEIPVPVYEELSSLEYSDTEYISDVIGEQDSDVNSDNEYMISNDGP
ncbi:hypothetical protein Trydic_g16658 [Trypoxylus dichotomus]